MYDPSTGLWAKTGNMTIGRYSHTATILTNGKVLVAGGYSNNGSLNTAELYDPATGLWAKTGSMTTARATHTASVLTNGKILVAGGYSYNGSVNSAELYDPSTGLWTKTGNMSVQRYFYTASTLTNGKVLVAGGSAVNGFNNSFSNIAELYDPSTGLWAKTGNMSVQRAYHTASILTNGKVLVTGGVVFNEFGYYRLFNSTEMYDPSTGLWTVTGNMNNARCAHTASSLLNGKLLIVGGESFNGSLSNAELYA
ncbi:unnamed protein product [Rotaria sp. Silwood2]|nr:unnamed protein product [Rotaria sp. Silwood2]CAF4269228.1 unnamed protein product [Rotaria sp. Silwood2]